MDSDHKLLSTHCHFDTKLFIKQAREKRINIIKDYKKLTVTASLLPVIINHSVK